MQRENFNDITAQQTALHTHVTRSVTSSKPLAITATKQVYFNSFLNKNLKRSEGALTHVNFVRLVCTNWCLHCSEYVVSSICSLSHS